jgi:hypothetical protein
MSGESNAVPSTGEEVRRWAHVDQDGTVVNVVLGSDSWSEQVAPMMAKLGERLVRLGNKEPVQIGFLWDGEGKGFRVPRATKLQELQDKLNDIDSESRDSVGAGFEWQGVRYSTSPSAQLKYLSFRYMEPDESVWVSSVDNMESRELSFVEANELCLAALGHVRRAVSYGAKRKRDLKESE